MLGNGTLSAPGMDKVIIKPELESVRDFQKLKENENVQITTTGTTTPILDETTGEYINVNRVYIKDKFVFKNLTVGSKLIKGRPQQHCYMDLTRVGLDDNNLIPYNVAKFIEHAEKSIEYANVTFGMKLNKNKYKGESMEINTNIRLDRSFNNYKFILELMHDLRKKGFNGQKYENEDKEFTGIKLFNDYMSIKIYNKSYQMATEKNYHIYDEIMRIEVAFLTQNKINDMFGTCYIEDITDEQIKEVLLRIVEKELFKPLEKYIDKIDKELSKILKAEKKRDIKKWKRNFLLKAGYVAFDMQQILDIIKVENPKNYSRDIKKLQSDIEDLADLNDNLLKLTEIKNKLFM